MAADCRRPRADAGGLHRLVALGWGLGWGLGGVGVGVGGVGGRLALRELDLQQLFELSDKYLNTK